jgi:hypothetical protein
MDGPKILARTLSVVGDNIGKYGNRWQYDSRSDRHSKVACWGVQFDLLQTSALLRSHVVDGKVIFGVNHEMQDFKNQRTKKLDLVVARPGTTPAVVLGKQTAVTFASLVETWGLLLNDGERSRLQALPELRRGPVGSVLAALEAKAAMTAHQRALPRLYDELNSSHLTVHAASDFAAAGAFVMVNVGTEFISSDINKWDLASRLPEVSTHKQPRDAQLVIDKVKQIARRVKPGQDGFDAIGIVVVDCRNDGSPFVVVDNPAARGLVDDFPYDQMIRRLGHIYDSRFASI